MDKETIIDRLWENSSHGTSREDVEAAYNAGAEMIPVVSAETREVCAKICEREHGTASSAARIIRAL